MQPRNEDWLARIQIELQAIDPLKLSYLTIIVAIFSLIFIEGSAPYVLGLTIMGSIIAIWVWAVKPVTGNQNSSKQASIDRQPSESPALVKGHQCLEVPPLETRQSPGLRSPQINLPSAHISNTKETNLPPFAWGDFEVYLKQVAETKARQESELPIPIDHTHDVKDPPKAEPLISKERIVEPKASTAEPLRITPEPRTKWHMQNPLPQSHVSINRINAPVSSVRPVTPKQILNSAKIEWSGPGESLNVGPYHLADPLTYWSESNSSARDSSCIDLTLPIGVHQRHLLDSLGYQPTYAGLSPNCRANYLDWMSTGRVNPIADIGYAFLFFHGLEKRLLLTQRDLSPIVKEVVRLLESYKYSGAFDGYLTRFLMYVMAREGIETFKEKWFSAVFEASRLDKDQEVLSVGLAWFLKQNRPLPSSWALRIGRLDPRFPRSIVLQRSPEEFVTLFTNRYRERFGEGLLLKAASQLKVIRYSPANPTLIADDGSRTFPPILIPNPLGLPSQFASIIAIWSESIEALKPLSRVLARSGEVRDRAAYDAMPAELKLGVEHPDRVKWQELLAKKTAERGVVLVPVWELATLQGIEPRKKLSTKQGELLAASAQAMSLAIEPDARISQRLYGWQDWTTLYPLSDMKIELTPHRNYSAAALMLELGLIIANADGNLDVEEVDHIAHALESQFDLNPEDTRRLEARRILLVRHPENLTVLSAKRISTLGIHQRETLGEFLVGVAASDGSIDPKEISALQAMFKTLDLGLPFLGRLIAKARDVSDEPVSVMAALIGEPGETIPNGNRAIPTQTIVAILSPSEVAPKQGRAEEYTTPALARESQNGEVIANSRQMEPELLLDEERIRHFSLQSVEFSRMWAENVDQPELEAESDATAPLYLTIHTCDLRFDGLDLRYHAILKLLLTKPDWPRDEFATVVKSAGLMTSATLDILNEWSIETHDDPIIEDLDDHLIVHSELISK